MRCFKHDYEIKTYEHAGELTVAMDQILLRKLLDAPDTTSAICGTCRAVKWDGTFVGLVCRKTGCKVKAHSKCNCGKWKLAIKTVVADVTPSDCNPK